jgi:hypothetical protein
MEAETEEEEMVEEAIMGTLAAAAWVAAFMQLQKLCAMWGPTRRDRRSLHTMVPS